MTDSEKARFDAMEREIADLRKVVDAFKNMQVANECGGGRVDVGDKQSVIYIESLRTPRPT